LIRSTAELALLSLRRPLLAALLAVGSPSKNPTRGVEYQGAVEEILKARVGRLRVHKQLSNFMNRLVVGIEIVVALAAVANTIDMSWELGVSTVFNPWCVQSFGPLVWATFALLIYILGNITFRLRVGLRSESGPPYDSRGNIKSLFGSELVLCKAQDNRILWWKDETYTFVLLAWFNSLITLVHIMFGTIWFSSILFISAGDALGVWRDMLLQQSFVGRL